MSPDRWILSSVRPQKIYSHLLFCTLLPWFRFSLLVRCLASFNDIHQWPVMRWWSIMFNLDTFIHVMGHVLVAICVKDLWDWWHFTYATSLIVSVFMRCHLSWLDSSILSDIFIHYENIVHYILYVAITTCDICLLCLFMAIVLLCIRDCYTVYL